MRADALRERLAALRGAGEELRRRGRDANLAALGRVLDAWSEPDGVWQQALVRELPGPTGFGAETVRAGLALALADWNGDALRRLVQGELGDGEARGHDLTAVLLAGSLPMPTLLALIAPLALGSPVLAKTASRDPVTAPLVARSLRESDPLLGRCCEVVSLPDHEGEAMAALLAADCVVATGSDATLAEVARRVPPSTRLVAAGHRLSLAVLAGGATRGQALAQACRGLARDVALWDQQGCLSPLAVYVLGEDAADRVADALALALAEAEGRWPRGRVDTATAAAIAAERSGAELRAAAGAPVRVLAAADGAWTLVREPDAQARPAPLHRFLRVHPLRDERELLAALEPLARHLAGVALAPDDAALARRLCGLGASRVCPPGVLQAPPLAWRREGRGVLEPLLRVTLRP